MGWSGLLYAAIVVGWAAYLVPLALRRYDEAARRRSIDRFSSAMRVLARKSAAENPDTITNVKPSPGAESVEEGAAPRREREPSRRAQRAAARAAARRRRRVLLFLVMATAVVAGVAAFALIPWWSVAVPASLAAAFLVICRVCVRRESEAYWERAAEREDAQTAAAEVSADNDDDEPTVEIAREELSQVAVAMDTADGETLWDPVSVSLPTYVSKPKAPRTIRTIDLSEPGTWTSGRTQEDAALAEQAEQAEAEAAENDEGAEPSQRAVGS